jgi:hypothetical protein
MQLQRVALLLYTQAACEMLHVLDEAWSSFEQIAPKGSSKELLML